MKKKVLTFGTFDLLHKGHEFYLKEAKKHGEELWVVVARDKTVKQIKGILPVEDEQERLSNVQSLDYVDKALLGKVGDKYAIIEEVNPDIICLGYDQVAFTDKLKEELEFRGLHPEIIRISSFKPEIYKSSKLR